MKLPSTLVGRVSLMMAVSFFLCTLPIAFQIMGSGDYDNMFLVWNLLLALVPLAIALGAMVCDQRKAKGLGWPLLGVLTVGWLMFFPNAPYVVTDVFHLVDRADHSTAKGGAYYDPSFWIDVLIWAFSAFVAHLGGLVSLDVIHRLWTKKVGPLSGWVLVSGVCFVSGFGVFLGRFIRWNSWHVLTHPHETLNTLYWVLQHPGSEFFAAAFGGFILVTYLIVRAWRPAGPG